LQCAFLFDSLRLSSTYVYFDLDGSGNFSHRGHKSTSTIACRLSTSATEGWNVNVYE